MEQWLEWARGPMFKFAFVVMALGLLRHFVVAVVGTMQALYRAGDKKIPYKAVFRTTLDWLLPIKKLGEVNRPVYSVFSMVFHVGLILTPIFLLPHIDLWRRGLGIGWPSIPHALADALTLITLATAIGLVIGRIGHKQARRISRAQDILLPPLLMVPFITGFLAMHPAWNPMDYNVAMFIHVMSANLIFILIPSTKLGHIILIPTAQLVSEVGWHFPAESGDDVAIALKKENMPI
jgi:nitrate reductase gamma subunit